MLSLGKVSKVAVLILSYITENLHARIACVT